MILFDNQQGARLRWLIPHARFQGGNREGQAGRTQGGGTSRPIGGIACGARGGECRWVSLAARRQVIRPQQGLVLAGLVALFGVTSLAGCSSPTGLMAVGEPGEVCVPAAEDGTATVGLDVLENTSGEAIRVTGAVPVGTDGLSVIGWSVVEPGDPRAAVESGYRQAPAGVDDGLIPAGSTAILVLGLELDETPGTSEAVNVSFDQGGREGAVRTIISLRVVPAGQVCS